MLEGTENKRVKRAHRPFRSFLVVTSLNRIVTSLNRIVTSLNRKGNSGTEPPNTPKKWWRNLLIKWRPLRRILLKILVRKSALKGIAIIGIGKHLFITIAFSVMISWIIHMQQGMIAYCANNGNLAESSSSIPRQLMDRQISGQLGTTSSKR